MKENVEEERFEKPLIDLKLEEKNRKAIIKKSRRKEKEERIKAWEKANSKVEYRVPFSKLVFGQGIVCITYKKKRYVFRDSNIRNYSEIIELLFRNNKLSDVIKDAINTSVFKVIIDKEAGTFIFKDIDICRYVNHYKDVYLPGYKKGEARGETPSRNQNLILKSSSTLKSMKLEAGNIRFYDGYYMIFHTIKGEIDDVVAPCRVTDPDSHEILNLVHKFFELKFEQMHIIVKYDDAKILEPEKLDHFKISSYIKELERNKDIKGEWWEEVQNVRKPSLKQCRSISAEVAKKKVSLKNGYLDILCSMQSDKKLIPGYEVNHGKEEDAFIFTLNMPNNRCAIIFENASNDASTTTWVFVTKNENYEACLNLVFDFFTDYTLFSKRSSLRTTISNPPEKFKAENYYFIDHDDLGQWLNKLEMILEDKSASSDIAFVPGLHIPRSSESRASHGETVTMRNLHNQLMRKLYERLCEENGKENVGTEIRVGAKRIDAVVKDNDCYNIYEVKTAENPFDCVTEAMGQLLQYAYLYCPNRIGKMFIVGAPETTQDVEQYLSMLRDNHSFQVYYMKI